MSDNKSMPNKPTSGSRATGPALEAMYQFLLWLIPTVEKFPRSQKFLLGDRLQMQALEVLEQLIEATFTFAYRDAALAQDGIRGGDVEEEIGQDVLQEKDWPFERHYALV